MLTATTWNEKLQRGELHVQDIVDQATRSRRLHEAFSMFIEITADPGACLQKLARALPGQTAPFGEYLDSQLAKVLGEAERYTADLEIGMNALVIVTNSLHARGEPTLKAARDLLYSRKYKTSLNYFGPARYQRQTKICRNLLQSHRLAMDIKELAHFVTPSLAFSWQSIPKLPSDCYWIHEAHTAADRAFDILELLFGGANRLGASLSCSSYLALFRFGEISVVLPSETTEPSSISQSSKKPQIAK